MLTSEDLQKFINKYRNEDVKKLALRYSSLLGDNLNYVMTQISGWQRCRVKIPSWSNIDGLRFPVQLSMEQCSSEQTAMLKAELIKGDTFVDLTGGFGVDCAFISKSFIQSTYVEQNDELAAIVAHNYSLLGLTSITTNIADGVSYLKDMQAVSVIYLDPARRDNFGRKMVSISDCMPNVSEIRELLFSKADDVWIKYSPMLDISLALKELESVVELYIISVDNECKELLFHLKQHVECEPSIFCINFQKGVRSELRFLYKEEANEPLQIATTLEKYLYEPNSSLLKSGCFKRLSTLYGVKKLDINSHLYTSEKLLEDFPGRVFQVEQSSTMNKKLLKSFLKGLDKANITLRNFPLSVEALRKSLKIKDGGDIYLFGTTINGTHTLVKCSKIK